MLQQCIVVCLSFYAWLIFFFMHDLFFLTYFFFAKNFCRLLYAEFESWLKFILCHNKEMSFCVFRWFEICKLSFEIIWLWLHIFLLNFVNCKKSMHNAQSLFWSIQQRTKAKSKIKTKSCNFAKHFENTSAAIQY